MKPHITTLVTVMVLAISSTAAAMSACEHELEQSHPHLPRQLEVPPEAGVLCGTRPAWPGSLLRYEVVRGGSLDTEDAVAGERYLLEFGDGRRAIWTPRQREEATWAARSADAIRAVTLETVDVATPPADIDGCVRRPTLEAGERYLLLSGDGYQTPISWVATTLSVRPAEVGSVARPTIHEIAGQELRHACSTHGLFVAQIEGEPGPVWLYEWEIRDDAGDVVQTGRGDEPHAIGHESEDGSFTFSNGHMLGDTKQPYRVGETYEMEVRAVGYQGQVSAPATAEFTFQQTAEGASFNGYTLVMIGMLAVGVFAAISGVISILGFLYLGWRVLGGRKEQD